MTEAEARDRIIRQFGVPASERVAVFLAMVRAENAGQNLIAPSTVDQIWSRHALDSAQLAPLGREGLWIDIGTGAGFPGLVVALLWARPMLLVEPRRRRAAFLTQCVERLDLKHVRVAATKIEQIADIASTISARAVASVENILHMAARCAKEDTRWLLPRGRFSDTDVAALRQHWRGVFHVEQSLTDPESSILVIDGARRR